MKGYNAYVEGTMTDYIPTDEDLQVGFDKLPIIPKNRNLKRCNLSNYLYELFHHTLICNYEEFELYKEHYDIVNYEITQCIVFKCVKGVIFEKYISVYSSSDLMINELFRLAIGYFCSF